MAMFIRRAFHSRVALRTNFICNNHFRQLSTLQRHTSNIIVNNEIILHSSLSRHPLRPWKIGRNFHISSTLCLPERNEWNDPKSPEEIVNIIFVDRDGKKHPVKGKVGDVVLFLAHRYNIEMEGACEGVCSCTTCHVYVRDDFGDKIPAATDEELDMLDMAPFLRENSRLGCQITLTKNLEGLELEIPQATRNFYVDGHKPTPH